MRSGLSSLGLHVNDLCFRRGSSSLLGLLLLLKCFLIVTHIIIYYISTTSYIVTRYQSEVGTKGDLAPVVNFGFKQVALRLALKCIFELLTVLLIKVVFNRFQSRDAVF